MYHFLFFFPPRSKIELTIRNPPAYQIKSSSTIVTWLHQTMKNTRKGNPDFSYSSKSPSFLSKIKSCFRPHKSSYRSSPPLLSSTHYGVHKASSPSTIPSKPVSHIEGHTAPSSYPSTIPGLVFHIKGHKAPSSSPSTIPSKPVSHDKAKTTPSSSSPTILKKPVSQHTVLPAASKQNTDPSMSEAVWTLATGAGKLALLVGKRAAQLTTGVVKGGIEIAAQHAQQIEQHEKLKETFACYYTDRNGTAYQGTLNFSNNQIIFSTDLPSHTTNENRNPPILPPGSSYKTKESELKLELKIPFGEVIEINPVNAENPSTRYIQIKTVGGSNYAFRGFVDYYKAYNHVYSLLPSSS